MCVCVCDFTVSDLYGLICYLKIYFLRFVHEDILLSISTAYLLSLK